MEYGFPRMLPLDIDMSLLRAAPLACSLRYISRLLRDRYLASFCWRSFEDSKTFVWFKALTGVGAPVALIELPP